MELSRPQPEPYSDSYLLFPDVEVDQYGGKRVAAAHDLVGHMHSYIERRPLLKLGGGHYWLYGEYGVPQNVIVVPKDSNIPHEDDDLPVLMAKDAAATQIMLSGQSKIP